MFQGKKRKWMKLPIIMLSLGLLLTEDMGILTEAKSNTGHDMAYVQFSAPEEPEPEPSLEPEESAEPLETPEPTKTAEPTETPESTETPEPEETPKPQIPSLKKVSGVKLVRYSSNAVKVTWKKHKKAKYYRVYYSKKKAGKYQLAGVTKEQHFLVTKLKNKKTYYFYVQACQKKKASLSDSAPSKKAHMTMKTYKRKIIFAGDSICQGVGYGQAFPAMHSSAEKKTVAYKGLNTITFHTKRIFNGKTGLQKLISEKPYRAYMMLGMNEVHYRPANQMILEYRDLIQSIQQASPETDIVLCAVSPVTRAERGRNPGMKQIPVFNKQLKKLAKQLGVRYLDYTAFLKDSEGYLKTEYATGDGYHWKSPAYTKFGTIVGEYDKSLDR